MTKAFCLHSVTKEKFCNCVAALTRSEVFFQNTKLRFWILNFLQRQERASQVRQNRRKKLNRNSTKGIRKVGDQIVFALTLLF